MRGRWKLIMIFESWASSLSHIHQLMIVQSYTLRNTILLVHSYNRPLILRYQAFVAVSLFSPEPYLT